MTRVDYAKRIALALVLGHLLVSLCMVVAAFASGNNDVLELLKISVPVTMAYAAPALSWFGGLADGTANRSRKKMDRFEATAYTSITAFFFLALLAIPVLLAWQNGDIETATTYFAGVEFVFGALIVIMQRSLFGAPAAAG